MHYYQHHIGDFIRDTSRLSDEQCMAYLRMIWLYYESEQPLPNNPRSIAFRVGSSEDVVSLILESFFRLEDDAWKHTRCESEMAEYKAICERNRLNGKSGGRPKKTQSVSSGLPGGTQAEPSRNPNHKPVTSNQDKPKPAKPPAGLSASDLVAMGVDEQVAIDFLLIRKAKRAPLSKTALKGIQKEAEDAGITLSAALAACAVRGWQTFKAEWHNKPAIGQPQQFLTKTQRIQQNNKKVFDDFLSDSGAIEHDPN